MKKVSVVIPAFNEEHNIGHCLDALLASTYKDFEVIVVDDASTDQTDLVLKRFRPSVRTIRNDQRKGPANCRNRGASESDSDYVFFIDADCCPEQDWIQKGVAALNTGVLAIEGGIYFEPGSTDPWVREPINPFYNKVDPLPSGPLNAPNRDHAAGNMAFHRKTLLRLGGFNENRYGNGREDSDFGWRFKREGKIVSDPDMRVFHRKKFWTLSALLENAKRYQKDVVFFKDHGFFFYQTGRILHPKFLFYLLFPPSILFKFRVRSFKHFHFALQFYVYLAVLRWNIWRAAWKERIFVI